MICICQKASEKHLVIAQLLIRPGLEKTTDSALHKMDKKDG